MIKRLLIANRGEIARRIIRTAREMGIETVALATESEKNAPWIVEADFYHIFSNNQFQQSWLNIDEIIRIAILFEVDAVHPGYGFLSENAAFAQAVEQSNMVFVGPTGQSIEWMGNKLNASDIARAAGVPVQVAHRGTPEELIALARTLNYPVLVKAAAGGGGKGMRTVYTANEYEQAIVQTSREALSYFGDGAVYVEALVENARHIEVQVFGDGRGAVIHLGERDCSMQRRHQKVIEEAPAIVLTPMQREQVTHYAVSIAKKINYRSAGTVEFLLDRTGQFWFLEMNTRIQVEHPVTEAVTGVDIVKMQLEIAAGKSLSMTQEQVLFSGHAIEVRLYAEKADQNFMPAAGVIHNLVFPSYSWLRVDSAFVCSGFAHPDFDPMIAKIIVLGSDRTDAIQKMLKVLKQTYIAGIETNADFLTQLIDYKVFADNQFHTRFIESEFVYSRSSLTNPQIIAALLLKMRPAKLHREPIWNMGFFRQVSGVFVLQSGDESIKCYVTRYETFTALKVNDELFQVFLLSIDEQYIKFTVNDSSYKFAFYQTDDFVWIFDDGASVKFRHVLPVSDKQIVVQSNKKQLNIVAPMYGKIVDIPVKKGTKVNANQTVVVLEAMKMENHIQAAAESIVKSVLVKQGEQVSDGQVLIEFE